MKIKNAKLCEVSQALNTNLNSHNTHSHLRVKRLKLYCLAVTNTAITSLKPHAHTKDHIKSQSVFHIHKLEYLQTFHRLHLLFTAFIR